MTDIIKQVKPKVITLQPPCISTRTLVWLQKQTHTTWSGWDAVVTSLEEYHTWHTKARIVGIIIKDVIKKEAFYEDLYKISSHVPLILLSSAVLETKTQEYWTDNYDNLMRIEDLCTDYPFLGPEWDKTMEDAVALFAHLSRYNRLIDCIVSPARSNTFQRNITVEHNIVPPNIWLVTQYFRHSNAERTKEIQTCLRRNVECADLSRIVLLTEKDFSKDYPVTSKIQQIIIKKRLTYAHFLQFVKERAPKNTIVILANADMYMDSLQDLWRLSMKNVMLSLLRWNVMDTGDAELFGPRADSQDTWIVLSDSVKEIEWTYEPFDIQLGQPGCDNIFAGLMLQNRFVLYNPSLTVKTYHLHLTEIRDYKKEDALYAKLYVNIVPSYIIDTKQERELTKCGMLSNEVVSFEIKSSSLSNEITYCTMLEKEGRYKWEPSVENFYFDERPIYHWKNACVTPNGLVYTPYTIYPGNDEAYPYWNTTTVHRYTPFITTDQMIAIPCATLPISMEAYQLHYLPTVLRLLRLYPSASFWVPQHDYLSGFPMSGTPLLVSYDIACYAKEVIGFVPGPTEVAKEDIMMLRKHMPSWTEHTTGKRCVIVGNIADKKRINDVFIKDWCIQYESTIDVLCGASLCILLPGSTCSLWALPTDACVIEFQQEVEITGENQHLAHVCELQSWILLLSKGTQVQVEKQIVQELSRWMIQHEDKIK